MHLLQIHPLPQNSEMDGIWGKAGVNLCIYLEVCMMFGSISGDLRTKLGGWQNGRHYEGQASLKECIGEIYFKEYDSLDDFHFEKFVERELSGASCGGSEPVPKISFLGRYLVGEGSHRCLSTTFSLEPLEEFRAEIHVKSFELIFVERLPHGVFADPFELQHLLHRGVYREAAVFGDTNLELPSFLSNRSLVEVHMDVDPNTWSNRLNFTLQLPLHARYQPLDDSGYTNVEFGVPRIFFRYKMSVGANIRSCVSVLKETDNIPTPKSIVWSLPSGIRAHKNVVSIVTFSSAVVSTLLTVLVAMRHSNK